MKLRPLRDRVIVKPLEYRHGLLFVAGVELRKGIVVACGPGRRLRRMIPWRIPVDAPHVPGNTVQPGQTFLVPDGPETGKIRPMSVRVGQCVEYGFRDVFEFEFEGEKLIAIKEDNIYGLTDARQDSGILEPVSAAID
jgi:co-chaperonin GroES (HSP10)